MVQDLPADNIGHGKGWEGFEFTRYKEDKMTHGSLFSGIGGFDLAAEWMGWDNKFHCEWNEFGQKILKYYWPKSVSYGDIKKTDFTIWRGKIDIVSGGFPCQPYSAAGKRKGKEDDRHLWPEMCRAIREIQPKWIVGENVSGLLNWNRGMVLDEIKADLEAAGFEVLPPFVLPACGVNAPHRRDRVWIVAYSKSDGHGGEYKFGESNDIHKRGGNEYQKKGRDEVWGNADGLSKSGDATDTEEAISAECSDSRNGRNRLTGMGSRDEQVCNATNTDGTEPGTNIGTDIGTEGEIRRGNEGDVFGGFSELGDATNPDSIRQPGKEHRVKEPGQYSQHSKEIGWHNFPTQSPICSRDDGLSYKLDGITFPKWRNESIKGYGNAIVPQVVYEIFKVIQNLENNFSV
jgi:DNA (cytosine-5)-methyltransferase 1